MTRSSIFAARARTLAALLLCAALGGCGLINWTISNSGDGCPPKSTFPCP